MRSPGFTALTASWVRISCSVMSAALLVAAAGCTGTTGPSVFPVTGKVLVDGEPRAGLAVIFLPDGSQGTTGPSANGTTDSQGQFTLMTLNPEGEQPGAIAGHFTVTVACPFEGSNPSGSGEEQSTPCSIAPQYSNYDKTPLKAEVKAASDTETPQEFTFEVTSS